MTETKKKALALVNEVEGGNWLPHETDRIRNFATICRAIEQHEAYKREVSDACKKWTKENVNCREPHDLDRFIIAKTDPLVEAISEVRVSPRLRSDQEMADEFRAAIEARGGRIVWEGE